MLDHHETVLALVHAQMMEPAGHAAHGTGADPIAFDAQLDADKLAMLALLSQLYGETYSPRADTAVPAIPSDGHDAASSAATDGAHGTTGPGLAAQLEAGVTLADRFLPRLKRPQVRDAARRIRASQLELARKVPATPAR